MSKIPARISRRDMLKAIGFAAGAATLAACAPAAAPTAKTGETAPTTAPAAGAAKKFTILHWAQGAEPTDPNAQLAEGQVPHVAYQTIADEYMKMKDNVEIEWYRFPAGSQFTEWLVARMTAQDAPDIYWANTEDLWPHINKGWALDFTPYMNQPNPYVSGNTAWKDQFQDVAIYSQTGPDGKLYGVNMDGAGVLTVYNKDAFAKAGIDKEPKTWTEFMAAWQKLLDAGYIPYGGDLSPDTCCYPHWLSAHMYNQLVWDNIYNWDDDKNKVIGAKELVNHYQKGDFMDWEAYLKFAKLFKDMTPFLPTGYEGKLDYRAALPPGQGGHVYGRQLGRQRIQGVAAAVRVQLAVFPDHHQGRVGPRAGEGGAHPGRLGRDAVSRARLPGREGRGQDPGHHGLADVLQQTRKRHQDPDGDRPWCRSPREPRACRSWRRSTSRTTALCRTRAGRPSAATVCSRSTSCGRSTCPAR